MLTKLFRNFLRLPFFIQLVLLLCMLGTCLNAMLLWHDLFNGLLLWRLHACYLILYAAQVVLILAHEKYVCLLTLLQGVLALLTSADFIFVPILQALGNGYYWLCNPSVAALKEYQYVFEALASSLQLAAAYYLWAYFRRKPAAK